MPPWVEPTAPPLRNPQPSGRDYQLIGGIAATAIGVGGVILFAVSFSRIGALQDDPQFVQYRAGIPANSSACTSAKSGTVVTVPNSGTPQQIVDLCDQGDTFESLAYVGLALGGLGLAGGIILIVTSDTVWGTSAAKKANSWRVLPQIGPSGGGALLRYRF